MIWLLFRYIKLQMIAWFGAPPIIPPPPPKADLLEPCPMCGTQEKKSIKTVGTVQVVRLQFECATCAAKWFKSPIREGTTVHEVWPAEILEPMFEVPTVSVS